MIQHLPAIIVFSPFLAALVCPFVSMFSKSAGRWVVAAFSAVSLVLSIVQLIYISRTGEISYWFGGWKPPYGIEFAVDSLSAVVIVLICVIGFLTMIYGIPFMKDESRQTNAGYYAVLSLLVCGLLEELAAVGEHEHAPALRDGVLRDPGHDYRLAGAGGHDEEGGPVAAGPPPLDGPHGLGLVRPQVHG